MTVKFDLGQQNQYENVKRIGDYHFAELKSLGDKVDVKVFAEPEDVSVLNTSQCLENYFVLDLLVHLVTQQNSNLIGEKDCRENTTL